MNAPYAVLSDLHFHNWSQFSTINWNGINSRLQIILDELRRAAEVLKVAGGKEIILTGDLFHVRGSVAPSVLNPVIEEFHLLINKGFEVHALPGNHDLEGKTSTWLGNAMQSLRKLGAIVYVEPEVVGDSIFIPWIEDQTHLKMEIVRASSTVVPRTLFIHAPVNGVLKGIPDTGLDPAWLASQGFKNVFAGHYHDAKKLADDVYSVGATTHQTWSDIGTRAGFWIVTDDVPQWHSSRAPKFVELTPDIDEEDWLAIADGNYVRATFGELTEAQQKEIREELVRLGAKGVVINAATKVAASPRTAVLSSGMSLGSSVSAYIEDKHGAAPNKIDIHREAQSVLTEATSVAL